MRAVSWPHFHPGKSMFWLAAVVAVLILGSALLAFAAGLFSAPLDPSPDGPLLGPFRWTRVASFTA
jgi:hypothetical protein